MTLQSKRTKLKYKGVEVEIDHVHYQCPSSGETFTTTELDEDNIHKVKIEYNKRNGI